MDSFLAAMRRSPLTVALAFAVACGGRARNSHDGPVSVGGNGGAAGLAEHAGGGSSPVDGGADAGAAEGGLVERCDPGRAPLRRLTRFEYSNSVLDLLGDTSDPGRQLPSETAGAGFTNNAAAQSVSAELAQAYFRVAKGVAAQATGTTANLNRLVPCAADVSTATADSCARSFVASFANSAYRRALTDAELTELGDLHALVRNSGGDFAAATAAVIAAVLQAPDFLYRLEWGSDDAAQPVRRPTGDEMATRLSYLFWGTQPDAALRTAASAGELDTATGVRAQAKRLLDDPRSHAVIAFFFESLLPVDALLDESRSDLGYSPALGRQMLQSAQRFLEYQIFEQQGTWPAILSTPTAFGGQAVAEVYGVTGIQGDALQALQLDPTERAGLLTQLAVLAGASSKANPLNPSLRGAFVRERLLCRASPPPHPASSTPSSTPNNALTTRERWTLATAGTVCQSCHQELDAIGFSLGNYDALGHYRTTENGELIDTQVEIAGIGSIRGPIELAQKLATLPEAQACFVKHWLEFGYGRSLDDSQADQCLTRNLNRAFKTAGYDVRKLLLDLTQTDAFLYLAKEP